MAIELGKVNVNDLTQNDYKILGIGVNTTSNRSGIFHVNYTTLSQAKYNLINLPFLFLKIQLYQLAYYTVLIFQAKICSKRLIKKQGLTLQL